MNKEFWNVGSAMSAKKKKTRAIKAMSTTAMRKGAENWG
jgi:hypothetical protein